MTISGSGEKPKLTAVENAINSNEAVKVSTRSNAANQNNKNETSIALVDNSDSEQGISVQLGLAKYLNQELDPQKIRQERLDKIAEIKNKIAAGTYLTSVSLRLLIKLKW